MNLKTKFASAAVASIFALSMGTAAFAQDAGSVTQVISEGELTYSISNLSMTAIEYAPTPKDSVGVLILNVNGNGNLDGWDLSVQATNDFTYEGDSADGGSISAANLSLTNVAAPSYVAGQPIDSTNGNGPFVKAGTGSLATAQPVIRAEAGYGSGEYTQELTVSLNVPAYSQAGTYTGEVTVTTTSAPVVPVE